MSFSCPHFDPAKDWCDRVRDHCVCGRPGCVLANNSTFAVPPAVRLAASRTHSTGNETPPPQSVPPSADSPPADSVNLSRNT